MSVTVGPRGDLRESKRVAQRRLTHVFRAFLAKSFEHVVQVNQNRSRVRATRRLSWMYSFAEHDVDAIEIEECLEKLESIQTSFVVVGAGDEGLNGEWRKIETGRYGRIVDGSAVVTWNSQAKEWQMLYDDVVKYRLLVVGSSDAEKGNPEEIPPISDTWETVEEGADPAPMTRAAGEHQRKQLLLYEVFDWSWHRDPPIWETDEDGNDVLMKGLERSNMDGDRLAHWRDVRGPYGESIATWLWILRSHDNTHIKLTSLYATLTQWILHFVPELTGVRLTEQPFVGQTILHQACAASDVELIAFMVKEPQIRAQPFFEHGFLEARFTGNFVQNVRKVPEALQESVLDVLPPEDDQDSSGPTPLDVACAAPTDDDRCEAILKLLLDAGASPIFYHQDSGIVKYNLLHVVAASSWSESQEEAPLMSTSRTKMVIKLFMSRQSKYFRMWGVSMRSQASSQGLTPLQGAAMLGNVDAFCEILEYTKVLVWQWGGKKEFGFPLAELDSGSDDSTICALELMTCYRHDNLLSLNLTAQIVTGKWEKFGQLWFCRLYGIQIACWCCTALVCLDDTAGYSWIRYGARVSVLTMALSYITLLALLFLLCARDEEWFKHMDFSIFWAAGNRVNFWQVLAVRNAWELFLMVLLALFPPWYAGDLIRHSRLYVPVWNTIASAWFLSGISFFLSYLELFKSTSALALAIPEVARRDMIPFFALFMVIYLSCAVALRIAVATSTTPDDRSFGSFWGVLKTLEEAAHGPDVQWRTAMEKQPQPAGAIFVVFLWITLIMLSLLIAMFSNTFDALRSQVNQRLMFRRAMFCVTIEKLFPQWYHQHRSWGSNGCNIGSKLGITASEAAGAGNDELTAGRGLGEKPSSEFVRWFSFGYGAVDNASSPTIPRQDTAAGDRWLLWCKNERTFETWRKPVEDADYGKHL